MPEIASFVHNGISIERHAAPPPMGPLGSVVLGLVGTAPDADPLLPKNSP
ncbi:phage tail protein, partial [Shewanella baltica]|nr:phage tail protein [Shewanella baltica]